MKTRIKKTIDPIIIALVAFIIVGGITVHILISGVKDTINNAEDDFETYIGTKCIIDQDTLTVVSYSIWDESFTLSNGRKVSYVLIGKNKY